MDNQAKYISQRLSLREPQKRSLDLLTSIYDATNPHHPGELKGKLDSLLSLGIADKFEDFERGFPSVTFALATGVGKTRLMGAFISWLVTKQDIRDYLVLAPNLPIYNKLIDDFSNNSSKKYVFQGIAEFVHNPPIIITGDNYAQVNTQRHIKSSRNQPGLFGEDIYINIFNISKINAETRGGNAPRIKRLREELGESYFEYLQNLKNLVILMDESHHYRAARGVEVIDELKPILGLELTATPYVTKGSKAIPFKNVVYEYPLANAVNDGLVKVPSIATRRNLDKKVLATLSDEDIDKMKLEDAIAVHRKTKIDLELYARNNDVPLFKPFILVITQDTDHAQAVLNIIQSGNFYQGTYKDKAITVHSALQGDEKEENIEKLVNLEDPRNNVEIVIHVNMLKEGWDVTNLYTIVPLRKFAALILTEQTLGRGLRLPYGKRTGVAEVDRLTVMAHDRFEELIEESKKPGNILLKEYYIESDDKQQPQEVVQAGSVVVDQYAKEMAEAQKLENESERKKAEDKISLKKIIRENILASSSSMTGFQQLNDAMTRAKIKASVDGTATSRDAGLFETAFLEVQNEFSTRIIEIPRITIQPATETHAGFEKFKLDTSLIPKFEPVSEQILVKYLTDHKEINISPVREGIETEEVLENTIVSKLIDYDDVDYDRDADLIYELSKQLISHLKSYLSEDDAVRNVVQFNVDKLAMLVHEQMQKHFFLEKTSFEKPNVLPFTEIYPHNYTLPIGQSAKSFRDIVSSAAELKRTLFTGFAKSCHTSYKFDSDPEKVFATILEDDVSVLKWLRPAKKQFNIYWKHYSSKYEPDFVVETDSTIFMVEVKREQDIGDADVQDKKRAALEYCKISTDFTAQSGGKPWHYLLIPHTEISPTKKMDYFRAFRVSE